ncbi:hypothetical protein G9A89_023577 [Geosiphon pyriformis]|nr:hypothetical protein G9A89_023577 [Geosiphon pyriformis]
MDENKSQTLHVTGILIYRLHRQVEFLLLNDNFTHKKHWTAPKGNVIGFEDELKCALRNTIEITGLSPKDLRIEENFRVEIKYLSGTRPKRVVYYLAQVSDHARVYTTGEGLNFNWLPLQNAVEKAIYRNMQDVLRQAASFIEKNKPQRNPDSSLRVRIQKGQGQANSDRLESRFKNLNLALPLDSQRQAMSRQRNELQNEQRQQNHHRTEKNGNGYSSPLHSPVMPFENPLYKTRLCERFETEGFCPYGSKCTFAHGTDELRERPLTEDKPGLPTMTKDGPENPLYKTRLCERFIKENFCQYGPKCNFAHGEKELREQKHHPPNYPHGEHKQNQNNPNYQRNQQQLQGKEDGKNHEKDFTQNPHSQDEKETRPFRDNFQILKHFPNRYINIPGDASKRSSFASATNFSRSEIQNGIFNRISIVSVNDSSSSIPSVSRVSPSQQSPNEEDFPIERHQAENHQEVFKNDDKQEEHMHLEIDQKENQEKEEINNREENVERKEIENKESQPRDLSPLPLANSPRVPVNARRKPAINDTVSLKDLLSGNVKPQNEKSWMKVVEFSDDELAKLEKIKKIDTHPLTVDKRSHEDLLVNDLKRFFATVKEQSKLISEEIKEITRIEMRHDLSKQQLFTTVIRGLYEGSTWDTIYQSVPNKEKLFKTYIHSSQDQIIFLTCWEKFFLQRSSNLIIKTPLLFKLFYDKDWIEEDSILEWYDKANDTSDVKKKCAIFVNWLREAEEEEVSDAYKAGYLQISLTKMKSIQEFLASFRAFGGKKGFRCSSPRLDERKSGRRFRFTIDKLLKKALGSAFVNVRSA